ncbi:tetratricopeptide repeat protein [bacterium]|nr:tetratricopeptide repeat protein [bacterium]
MIIWRWAGIGLIALMLGCTGLSKQTQGDAYFSQKEYQKAMQSYINSLQVRSQDGSRYIRYSPEIMTKIGISALNMNMLDGAIKVFRYVNQKSPSYGAAYFYLGMCYERQGKSKLALPIYANYKALNEGDPARDAMKGRLYFLNKQQYIQEAKKMAARGPDDQADFSSQRMVVLDFHYAGSDLKGTIISAGIASLVIHDFNRIGGFQVVPREKTVQLMQALGWSPRDLENIDHVEKLQRLLNVGTVVQGKIEMRGSGILKIDQRTLTFTGVRHIKESDIEGELKNIIVLQKKIVLNVLSDLGVQLTASQMNRLKMPSTRNFQAFLNYAYALYALDHDQYDTAQKYLASAVKLDPGFILADQIMASPDVFKATQNRDWMALQTKMITLLKIGPSTQTTDVGYDAWVHLGPVDRLQEMGWYLDAGFIPGSDSREAFEEINIGELADLFPDLTKGLPDPPDPPNTHYPVDPWYLPDPPPPPHRP